MLIKYNNSLLSIKKSYNDNILSFSLTNFMRDYHNDEIVRFTLSGMLFYISEVCEAKLSWGSSLIFLWIGSSDNIMFDLKNHKKFHELLLSISYYNYL